MIQLLVTLLIIVVIFGLIIYAVQLLPIAPPFKQIAYVITIIILLLVLLGFLGLLPGFHPVGTVS